MSPFLRSLAILIFFISIGAIPARAAESPGTPGIQSTAAPGVESTSSAIAIPTATPSINPLEEAAELRDPFKRPASAKIAEVAPSSPLETYPIEQFKLVGVITGMQRLRAILQDPAGKTHFVTERMRIGTRRGVIREIRADAVIVREKMVNVLGKEEVSDSEIRLPEENTAGSKVSGENHG